MDGLKRNTLDTSENVYSSLDDIPLYNWMKMTEEFKYEYICKDPKNTEGVDCEKHFEVIYDKYIKEYGLGKLFKRLVKLKEQKILLQLDFVIHKDAFKLTEIKLKEAQIEEAISNAGEGMSISESLIYLGKWVGYRLNPKEVTVSEYFNIKKLYGEANKKK